MRRKTTTCRRTPSAAATMKATTKGEQPRAGRVARHVAEVAAEQIDRAVRQIDVAHEAEDQGEAARDQEVEAAERDPVEHGVEEELLPAERLLEAGRPGREDKPDEEHRHDDDSERPQGTPLDEPVHRRRPAAEPSRARTLVMSIPIQLAAGCRARLSFSMIRRRPSSRRERLLLGRLPNALAASTSARFSRKTGVHFLAARS